MRRILINDKNEFSFSEIKISDCHQGVKQLGRFFESRNTKNQTGHSVIVSNKAGSSEPKNRHK